MSNRYPALHSNRCHKLPLETLESRTLLASAPYDYVSDLSPTYATNGYGPIGLDKSNGEADDNDGVQLKINGVRYKKGLGVHADSELRYNLAGRYRNFVSDIGVDDEVGFSGSVAFQVFTDGAKVFDSGVMTGAMSRRRVNVDVTGAQELALVVTGAGDGIDDDHADWGGAHLTMPTGNPAVLTMPADVSLEEPIGFFSADGTFADATGGPFSATVDWGDGAGTRALPLPADGSKSFHLEHSFDTSQDGQYTVTVRLGNGLATAVGTTKVTVTNVAPYGVGLLSSGEDGALTAVAGIPFSAGGIFSDPGEFGGEQYSLTLDYGDNSPEDVGDVSGRFYSVYHTYNKPGTYTLTSTITDEGGKVGTGTNTVVVKEPTYSYLSDMTRTFTEAGSSAIGVDKSSGGRQLKINGQRYSRGIGVGAGSELRYDLNGQYYRLVADVGVDDEVGANGSVVFQVWADGTKLFDSGTMTGLNSGKRLNLDVHGVHELKLVVLDAGNGNTMDHADWAGIRLI
jgi:hypothetical protein